MRLLIAAAAWVGMCGAGWSEATKTYTGRVLPFEVITAIRNYGFPDGKRPAQVAVAVKGGSQADWLATAAFVAEHSIVSDVAFAEIEVYVATPWGDLPPTRAKQLAKAYYGGPDPHKSPWEDDPFRVFAQGHAPDLASVEFYELSAKMLDQDATSDPDAVDLAAAKKIKSKYHLPISWKPDENVGPSD